MWLLSLNPMQEHTECMDAVVWSETKEGLEAFIERERVEPYKDSTYTSDGSGQFSADVRCWYKVFRKGGPLEWYNPPETSYGGTVFRDMGTREDYIQGVVERASQHWDSMRSTIMMV